MQKQKQLHYAVVGVLGFALLFMSIGFVAYAQILNSDSAAAISTPVYRSIGFDADSYQESDTSSPAILKTVNKDNIELTLQLDHPGDRYAALVNITNRGSVDEVLSEITMSELNADLQQYIDYHIEYDNEDYIGTSYGVDTAFLRGDINRQQMMLVAEYKENAPNVGPIYLELAAGLVFAE